jgi:hypothetical protein
MVTIPLMTVVPGAPAPTPGLWTDAGPPLPAAPFS